MGSKESRTFNEPCVINNARLKVVLKNTDKTKAPLQTTFVDNLVLNNKKGLGKKIIYITHFVDIEGNQNRRN